MLLDDRTPGVRRLYGDVFDVTDPSIIRAAWGPRRVSSRRRGMDIAAYPKRVSAARSLWEQWLAETRPETIVIAKKKAQARIDAALGRAQGDPETAETEPSVSITQDEIDDMLAERADLRAARQFSEADKIRDYLVRHGVEVQDGKVKT